MIDEYVHIAYQLHIYQYDDENQVDSHLSDNRKIKACNLTVKVITKVIFSKSLLYDLILFLQPHINGDETFGMFFTKKQVYIALFIYFL